MQVSIVIPTYNRPAQLSNVIRHILASEVEGFDAIEIIVVDDGSSVPAGEIVESINPPEPFRLKYIYQDNAGPAEARNRGFREAEFDIVLFIDDDILVLPDLIKRHCEAHEMLPGSVIFGRSPFVEPNPSTASYRFLASFFDEPKTDYERVTLVASGNLSVERRMFLPDGVYKNGLRVPAAEEFELEQRLNEQGVPIYIAHRAVGWHLQPSTIADKCVQEYKYGIGAAEVWTKLPEIARNAHIASFILENGYIDWSKDPMGRKAKKLIKSLVAGRLARSGALALANMIERTLPSDRLLFPLYRYLCGINLFAGVREGLETFDRTVRR